MIYQMARKFYEDLGCRVGHSGVGWVDLELYGHQLTLFRVPSYPRMIAFVDLGMMMMMMTVVDDICMYDYDDDGDG